MRRARDGYASRALGASAVAAEPVDGRAFLRLPGAALSHRRLILLAAAFAACAVGLWVVHRESAPHYRLSAAGAIAAARRDASDRELLSGHPAGSARVIPLDQSAQRVTFFDGPRAVLDAAVNGRGEVIAREEHLPGTSASGAAIANSPWVLALLSGVFLLATGVAPLRRARNLDALALASLTLTVPLINAHLVAASVLCAEPALCYLTARCLWVGLRPAPAPAARPSTPLLQWLWAGWEPAARRRTLRLLLAAAVAVFATVTLTSSGYTDVAAASLEGATDLLHGAIPYGNIHLAFHGDTYPLLNYVLYMPAALWRPVSEPFSDMSGSLVTALLASLLAGWALYRVAQREPGGEEERDEDPGLRAAHDENAGLRAALAWFAYPPVLLAASGGANDLVLAACLAWMLALRTRTAASALALAMGVWVKLVPIVLLAIWIPHRRRELVRSGAVICVLSAVLLGALLALGGPGAISAMAHAFAFQFQRGSFFAPWYTFHVQWLQPLAQAAVLAMLVAAIVQLRADPSTRTDLARLSALAAALLLGVQLAANYWTWSYLPWVFPFLAAALFMGGSVNEGAQVPADERLAGEDRDDPPER